MQVLYCATREGKAARHFQITNKVIHNINTEQKTIVYTYRLEFMLISLSVVFHMDRISINDPTNMGLLCEPFSIIYSSDYIPLLMIHVQCLQF